MMPDQDVSQDADKQAKVQMVADLLKQINTAIQERNAALALVKAEKARKPNLSTSHYGSLSDRPLKIMASYDAHDPNAPASMYVVDQPGEFTPEISAEKALVSCQCHRLWRPIKDAVFCKPYPLDPPAWFCRDVAKRNGWAEYLAK